LRALSKRYGINQKTVAKWKKRTAVKDLPTDPKDTHSTVLSIEDEDKEPKRKFKTYPIGYFHVDIAEVQTAEGKLRLFVAIDRTSKFAFVELHREAGKATAAQFLRNLIAAVPYAIHIVLTDNLVLSLDEGGIQFTNMAHHKYAFHHIFDRVCDEHEIEHRLTKIKHPWNNGQVERMNRTIKEATVKR
jgi:Integrase core domain